MKDKRTKKETKNAAGMLIRNSIIDLPKKKLKTFQEMLQGK